MTTALTIICLALLAVHVWRERMYDKLTLERDQAWRLERAGLLTRIQHPQIISPVDEVEIVPDEEQLTAEPDDIDLVGTVQVSSNGR